jgi:hypothetical protein
LVLFGMQNRIYGPYLAAINRVLISLPQREPLPKTLHPDPVSFSSVPIQCRNPVSYCNVLPRWWLQVGGAHYLMTATEVVQPLIPNSTYSVSPLTAPGFNNNSAVCNPVTTTVYNSTASSRSVRRPRKHPHTRCLII